MAFNIFLNGGISLKQINKGLLNQNITLPANAADRYIPTPCRNPPSNFE